ncbi:hypothetical protein NL676_005244 [Syzygium grande]|nr:hypothetical protein NL676_005244 [Syzygium grande]
MDEGAMMDHEMVGIAGSNSRKRAKLWIEPRLNSYGDKVCAKESQVFSILGEENNYKSKDAESYKQDAPVNASQGIEGNHGYAQLKSIKDHSEKANKHICSI